MRGKYYASYNEGHNLVFLKPEVAKAFPSKDSVNDALALIKIAQGSRVQKVRRVGAFDFNLLWFVVNCGSVVLLCFIATPPRATYAERQHIKHRFSQKAYSS